MEKIKVEKGSVQEKCLANLYPRRLGLDWFPNLVLDKGCIALFDKYDYQPAKYADKISKMEGCRLCMAEYNTIQAAKRYMRDHPKCTFVNLSCGFSTVFPLLDNGQCKAYNVDLRDVLIARKEAVGKGDREQGIIANILDEDFSWFDKIEWDRDEGIFFYAIDVFHYFKREDVKRIVAAIADKFRDGMMVFDACSRDNLKNVLKLRFSEEEVKENVGFYFSVDEDSQLQKWSVKLVEINRWAMYEHYTKKELMKRVGLLNVPACKSSDSKMAVQFVELKFKR